MRESGTVENARRALGGKLAACRHAAGYSQARLAAVLGYSRSTIANVEVGRQHVPRSFWVSADEAVHAQGALIGVSDEIDAAASRERTEAAQATRLYFAGMARDGSAVTSRQLVRTPGDAGDVPGHGGGWLDAIALAASQARADAEQAAVTDVGPGTVDQFRADVVRLGRAYVSAPPLPLFTAMHQTLNRVQQRFAAGRTRTMRGI